MIIFSEYKIDIKFVHGKYLKIISDFQLVLQIQILKKSKNRKNRFDSPMSGCEKGLNDQMHTLWKDSP